MESNNRVAAYIFYSINDMEKVEKHKKEIINYAKEHLNIEESHIDFFIDIGPRETRTNINELFDKIKDKQYDVLIIPHLNHLYKARIGETIEEQAEEMRKLNEVVDKIVKNNVELISVLENKRI